MGDTRPERHGVATEPDRVAIGLIAKAAALLIVVSLATMAAVWGFFHVLENRTRATEARPMPVQAERLASPEQKLPPEPRLEINAPANLARLRAEEDVKLTTYGWVDRPAGVVRIPIDRAINRMLEREKKK